MAKVAPRPAHWPAVVLLLAALTLAAADWQLVSTEVDTSAIAPSATAAKTEKNQNDLDAAAEAAPNTVDVSQLTETLARPLFRHDRRPFVPKAAAAPPPVEPPHVTAPAPPPPQTTPLPAGLKLVGIVVSDDGERHAVIRTEGSRGAQSYPLEATIGGWRLTAIDEDAITLSANGATVKLELFASQGEETAAPAGDAPAALPEPQSAIGSQPVPHPGPR